jgi:hypothetical protein
MIYFIGNKEMNICKIGYSKRPYRRIDTLRKNFPFELEIFSIVEGGFQDEKMYHSKYYKHKIKGEWFKLNYVEELGFNKAIIVEKIEHICLNINEKTKYIHLNSLLAQLNKDRINENMNIINFNIWLKNNEEFVKTIDNPIIKDSCLWINIFICYELIRVSTIKNKIILYKYLYKLTN